MDQANTALATTDQPIVVDELVTDSRFDTLPLWDIRISKTNRKRFNETALKELAANIKTNGLIQPILLRPVDPTEAEPQHYEIVCGERRYRASIIAGLASINVIIRTLSDTQAAELQLIENLQREDPHPMEEAEGYQALMMHSGYTADMLAEKLNKSKSQIYSTLKLCNLCKELRDEFFNNEKFNRSLALLVARIPVPALQVEAYNEIIDERGDGEPMSYRDAAEHIQAHYNVHLKTAIFSTTDTRLLLSAGSCRDCKKRTGNDPDLADLDKNICTDPKCYEAKCVAHNAKIIEKAERNNITILQGEDAQKAISQAINRSGRYAIDSTCLHCFARVKNHADRNKMIIVAIGSDKLPDPIAIAVDNGSPVKLYNSLHIQITLEELGFCETESKVSAKAIEQELESNAGDTSPGEDDDHYHPFDDGERNGGTDQKSLDQAAQRSEEKRALVNEEIKRIRIYKAIRARGQLSVDSLCELMKQVEDKCVFPVPDSMHVDLYGQSMDTEEDRLNYIDNATCEQLQLLLIDYFLCDVNTPYSSHFNSQYINRTDDRFAILKSLAEHEGIDIAIAEQEPIATPAPKKYGRPSKEYQALLDAKAAEKKSPEAPSEPATTAPKKRGRPSKADKAAQEAASKPAPVEQWPFPTPKKESAES